MLPIVAGVAIAKGTDVAVETSDIVLMKSDLTDLVTVIDLSRETVKRIKWNFRWAICYNVIAIPFAAGVFFPLTHTLMSPVVAAVCMGFSSVSVVLSSLYLKLYTRPLLDGSGLDMNSLDSTYLSPHVHTIDIRSTSSQLGGLINSTRTHLGSIFTMLPLSLDEAKDSSDSTAAAELQSMSF